MVLPQEGERPEGNHKGCPYGDSAVVGMTGVEQNGGL